MNTLRRAFELEALRAGAVKSGNTQFRTDAVRQMVKLMKANAVRDDRGITYTYTFNAKKVETFYDRTSRNWITTFKVDGNQQGSADYSGTVEDAAVSFCRMVIGSVGKK